MKKLIMIKYGELITKKDNRSFFINTLSNNIETALSGLNPIIKKDYYRMFIEVNDTEEAINRLKNVFGIHEIDICYFTEEKEVNTIKEISRALVSEGDTFKVETNRSDKSFPINSMDLSREVGGYILKNISNIKVDVKNPKTLVNIEIRNEGVYIYKNGIKGKGGYPTGTLGKALLMLSGGIDSVVAGYLTMKRGVKLDFIYFESIPHTSLEAREKVINLAKVLKSYGNTGKLYIINFTKLQEAIYTNCDKDYMITIMRRQMYRIGERLAKRVKANAIVNGESIGQVASQTLYSMRVIEECATLPFIRPLATADKIDIIEKAKQIGTYDISIRPYEDCCTIFTLKDPVTHPNIDKVREIEEAFDWKSMVRDCVKNVEVEHICKLEEEEF